MSNYKYNKDKLLEATNGGLDIILHFYPEADRKGGGSGKFPHFKTGITDEATASAIIYPTPEGNYIIKDFGGGDDLSPFDVVMQKQGLEFYDACKWIAATFNIEGMSTTFGSAVIEIKAATENQKHGDYIFKYRPQLTPIELETLGPLVTDKTALEFNLFSCKWFIQIKQYPADDKKYPGKKMQIITKSSDAYPILVFENDIKDADGNPTGKKWQKIYQPLNQNKNFRFRYAGKKPQNYLFGKDLIEDYYFPLPEGLNEHNTKVYDPELDERADVIVIAGGDRDALNVASLEYPVVWKNSETEPLRYEDFNFLKARCKKLCYVGDLDATGVQETVKIALQYLDLNIIHLPQWLKKLKYRGKAQKDMTDYCKAVYRPDRPYYLKNDFDKLVKGSLPARFWDFKYSAKGEFKGYDINNEAVYRFLQYQGFYQIKEPNKKDPFSFVRLDKNIVTRIETIEIKNFPAQFVREKKKDKISLINHIHRSAQLSDKKLTTLDVVEPDFKSAAGPDHQCFFFNNRIWKVTPDSIKEYKYGALDVPVWQDRIIPHDVTLSKSPLFKIEKTGKTWKIEILRKDNPFFNYLINTARVHWKICGHLPFVRQIEDLDETDPEYNNKVAAIWAARDAYRKENNCNLNEAGLNEAQINEQHLHLINRIFAFGFVLHNYKLGSKGWSVFAMDNRLSDISDSNGGTGKSLTWQKALKKFYVKEPFIKTINAGDTTVSKQQFLFDGVTKDTGVVVLDDMDSHFPMRSIYAPITGDFPVNGKFMNSVSLDYEVSPKLIITSNFGIYGFNESTTRRLLYTVYSDYYHVGNDSEMLDELTVAGDLGFDLWSDFTPQQMSDFYFFGAQACQFQLQTSEKINPPMDNVNKRNALATIGDAFKGWADLYFEDRKNIMVPRTEAFESAKLSLKIPSAQNFKNRLEGWCKYYNYTLNPKLSLNNQGYCKHNVTRLGKTVECVYIKTPESTVINKNAAPKEIEPDTRLNPADVDDLADEDKDDIPY